MRTIHTDEIIKNIKEMCIEANLSLTEDMKCRFKNATESEKSPLGKQILNQLQENMEIAADQIPICQDTGMAIVFLNIGQDVHIEGMDLHDAVNEGVRQGYTEGYLRKSVVKDPLIRENTKDNTPAIMHIDIVPGENLEILVAPMVVGVGLGGSFEKAAFLAKKALMRNLDTPSEKPHIAKLEKELLEEINQLGIGPGGLGGSTTALGLNIETYPTHIAGMPLAVNICCHVNRHAHRVL